MSASVSTNFKTSFDAMVKQAYQGMQRLGGTVRTKTGVNGSTHKFPKMGKGLAQPRITQTDVSPMNITHSVATATLSDWCAPEYSDIYDLEKLTFDERKELATTVAGAMGRRMDQLVIDAMDTSAYATQVGVNLGGTNTGINLTKLLRAKRLLDDNGVPAENRHLAISAYGLEQALAVTQVGSADYNILRPLMDGTLKSWGGFQFHMIETRTEGGLPVASSVRNGFAWHQDAVGLAIGIDMRTEMNYIPEKTSWLINGIFSAGAVSIDTDGILDVLSYEA